MRYLLDTHIILWALMDQAKLSKKVKEILSNPSNQILVSSISFWEVSLKYSLGKLDLTPYTPSDLPRGCADLGFIVIPLLPEISSNYHKLKATYHKDPFDRMLIWEALQSNIPLISKDENVEKYQSEGLVVIW